MSKLSLACKYKSINIGKFSGTDPVPQDKLTFEQWQSDVHTYQRKFSEYVLLPAVRKSIQGKAKTVLQNLGPELTIDQAILALSREYKGVASSDVVFKQFYELQQEPKERVEVFSVRLREALNKLTLRLPDRIPVGDEDRILLDQFFYGMKNELKSSVRHLFDSPVVTFNILLTAARRNELEDLDSKTKIQSKAQVVRESSTSPRTETLKSLQDQLSDLTVVMKSGNFPKKSNPLATNPRIIN